ncbi:MAG TPA: L,D-transpeptidase family protein [Allosphingosinicella sp.]|nr:L,D-transpeptidase family protein [Allosphingosinicella sp.]
MNIGSWSLPTAIIGLTLATAPVQSSAAEEAVPAVPAAAAAPAPAPAPALEVGNLAPGAFVWRPELAAGGAVEIVVSIPRQLAYVYRGGTLIGVSTVSTGRPGHPTPTGRFPILEKHREHYSNRYNNAPMPFMQRLTMDGIALHAGQIPGHPASHGCVRLPLAFARSLFAATRVGAAVHILDASPSAESALAVARGEAPVRVLLASVAD